MLWRHFIILNFNLYFHLRYNQATNSLEDVFPFYRTVILCTRQCFSYGPWSFISEYLNKLIILTLSYIRLTVAIKRYTSCEKTYLLYFMRIKDPNHVLFTWQSTDLHYLPIFFVKNFVVWIVQNSVQVTLILKIFSINLTDKEVWKKKFYFGY